ncbi:MAG TPA: cellulose binding domain-containing protein [Acetivibrio sp.]|uniref:cellulose binding domain-containing protein n=1 Tax=Acetivibrio sp. TaxID=1872092 RepID=UPI002C30235D|nr:cellulose binding domain-containing protein [Acetivibrio sp.]HOM02024.1 cellulose binding domain-containing protein [Acetivibrio sp.]
MKWYYKSRVKRQVIKTLIILPIVMVLGSLAIYMFVANNRRGPNGNDGIFPDGSQSPSIVIATSSNMPEATSSSALVPEDTFLPEPTSTPTSTNNITPSPTVEPTAEPTATPTFTPTFTPTLKPTSKPTATPTRKPTSSPTPTPTPTQKPTQKPANKGPNITVQYKNGDSVSSVSVICPIFKITNNGDTAIKLSDIVIRYYYTKEGDDSETFWCNDFSRDSSQVYGSFAKLNNPTKNADHYLNVGFYDKAGSLNPGESVELKVCFAKNGWSKYDQFNDYSYNKANNRFINWDHITVYVSGKLVYGKEP